jgi:hypothetical protein
LGTHRFARAAAEGLTWSLGSCNDDLEVQVASEPAGDIEILEPSGRIPLTFDAVTTLLDWIDRDPELAEADDVLRRAVGGSQVRLPDSEVPTLRDVMEKRPEVLDTARHTEDVRQLLVLLRALRERES